ncbi:hypothetical protein BJ138DRAFT_1068295 [Hygrophoropsis aurantiaca]|uniref:Uncharacterized protein n=1 Tax=Hygrophoropsis aurantiaca TaxID=72124 RepID=A0ACB8A686_9AGAM|nr:hypothetical protein BJ138DRAFT_1068295 [Hygrophoropsis aurantiaca]
MHVCLYIPEILSNIFQNITHSKNRLDKTTLASLARTSRVFQESALDILYSNITGLNPLVKCMPQDLWEESKYELTFTRRMTTDDWNIFQRYACRVKTLSLGFQLRYYPETNLRIYQALSDPPFSSTPFSKLRCLQHIGVNDDVLPFLQVLLLSPLKELYLDVSAGKKIDAALSTFLPNLRQHCPFVTHLRLRSMEPRVITVISSTLRQFSNLQVLKCGIVMDEIIIHAAHLPSLTAFHLTIPASVAIKNIKSILGGVGFPVLREIQLNSPTLETCLRFLELSTSSFLESLTLTVGDQSRADDLHSVFAFWSSSPTYRNLSSIHITELDYENLTYDGSYVINFATLKPLLELRKLTSLNLELFCTFHLDDAAIMAMSTAWPLLEQLDISYREQGWEIPTTITLPGITPLLKNCPYLRYLGLVIDATVVSGQSDRLAGGGVRNTSLVNLYLADSPITRPPLVAAFLSSVAPRARLLAWNSETLVQRPEAARYSRRWKQVQRMLGAIVMARNQERMRNDLVTAGDGATDNPVRWSSDSESESDTDLQTKWMGDSESESE